MRGGEARSWFGLSDPPAAAAAEPAPASPRWPADRLAAVEALWGSGFCGPGGAPETLRLCKPLALTASNNLLLLGGGLGGPAGAITDGTGAQIDNYECDAELAAAAERRLRAHPAAAKLRVRGFDRAHPSFKARGANHALAMEVARGADLPTILEAVAAALRPRGQIVLTELVADVAAPETDREYAAWCRLENRLPALPRPDAVSAALTRLRFDIQAAEDVSDRHVAATRAGWRGAVKSMADGPRPSAAAASVIVTEAELWLLRIRLMRRFGIRLMRWHAIGAA